MTLEDRLADVISEHHRSGLDCSCGKWTAPGPDYHNRIAYAQWRSHVATELAAVVRDADREARTRREWVPAAWVEADQAGARRMMGYPSEGSARRASRDGRVMVREHTEYQDRLTEWTLVPGQRSGL